VAGVGEVLEHTKAASQAVDQARKSVRVACDLLTATVARLDPLLSDDDGPERRDGPELRAAIAGYSAARDVLVAQLAVLDAAAAKL
jgi:hypothetical protein